VEPAGEELAFDQKVPSSTSRVDSLPAPPAEPPPLATWGGPGDTESPAGMGLWGLRASTSSGRVTMLAGSCPGADGAPGTEAASVTTTRMTWSPTLMAGKLSSRRPAFPLQRSRAQRSAFYDAKMLEETAKEVAWRGEYDVADLYHSEGRAQRIARHPAFGAAQMGVVFLNAIWIGLETDYNDKEVLYEADVGFVLMENMFCLFFLWEWLVRLCAFRRKVQCIGDFWFVFDTILLVTMVLETWILFIVSAVSHGGSGSLPTNLLRVVRLARLTRSVRIARFLRSIPELAVIMRGILVVMRTVFLILILLTSLLYVFSILFVQVARDTALNEKGAYRDVPSAMMSLVLSGLIPDMAPATYAFAKEHVLYAALFMVFVFLGFVTIMNMLIGVLVQVVSVVATVEAETNQLTDVKSVLLGNHLDLKEDDTISMHQINLLLGDEAIAAGLGELSIDTEALMNHSQVVFCGREDITMYDFWQLAVQHRGGNVAKVKDLVNIRQFIYSELASLGSQVARLNEINAQVPPGRRAQLVAPQTSG